MRMEQFEYLSTISHFKSLSAASKALHLTTPALSMSIKSLEDELGFALLYRLQKGVILTERGEALIALYQKFAADILSLKNMPSNTLVNPLQGMLHVYVNYGCTLNVFSQYICRLYEAAPALHITVTECAYAELLDNVASQNIEFGITVLQYANHQPVYALNPQIQFTPLFSSNILCLAHKFSPIAQYKSISLKKLIQYPCIINQPVLPSETSLLNLISCFVATPQIEQVSSVNVFDHLISANLKIGLIPAMQYVSNPQYPLSGTVAIPVNDSAAIAYGYVTPQNYEPSFNSRYFLTHFSEFIQAYPQNYSAV